MNCILQRWCQHSEEIAPSDLLLHSPVFLCTFFAWLHDGNEEGSFQVRSELSVQDIMRSRSLWEGIFFARQSELGMGKAGVKTYSGREGRMVRVLMCRAVRSREDDVAGAPSVFSRDPSDDKLVVGSRQ